MKHSRKLQLSSTGGWGHVFRIPQDMGDPIYQASHKRVICQIGESLETHSALLPQKSGGYVISVGKAKMKAGNLIAGAWYEVTIQPDTTEYQMEMPEELLEVLETDPEAWERFDQLTPGKKRSILHSVGSAKQSETRIRRALKIAENLRACSGFTLWAALAKFCTALRYSSVA